eukprot:gnl/TRDRNA2_/TRDRNA2_188336_c0_seq1.p1 gnl/TRDRNA2_/TRDRNA2_188336_c0~~gnl/TRDRNA2_/TRDRNA2_188336_c0_seq1.p1  ORF type:complete len:288 (+),score=42.01 gnl/TRDRNA2_/TRDRNA2_188336_c0_seq1:76-939(+)
MHSRTTVILFACMLQASAGKPTIADTDRLDHQHQESSAKFADHELLNRAIKLSPLHHVDLESTTLGKQQLQASAVGNGLDLDGTTVGRPGGLATSLRVRSQPVRDVSAGDRRQFGTAVMPALHKQAALSFPTSEHFGGFPAWRASKFALQATSDKKDMDAEEATKKYGLEVGLFKAFTAKEGESKVKPQDLLKKYGIAYLATSISLAIVSYATCYGLVSAGIDVAALLAKVGIQVTGASSTAGTAAIAYVFHKAASPIRFPPTVALTPFVAKWIGKEPASDEPSGAR